MAEKKVKTRSLSTHYIFLFMITYPFIPYYSLSNDYLFYIYVFQISQLLVTVKEHVGAPCFSFAWVWV
jgi:hypothetical protein